MASNGLSLFMPRILTGKVKELVFWPIQGGVFYLVGSTFYLKACKC